MNDAELRYRLVAEATDDGVWFWDIRTDRVEWNARLAALTGLPPGERVETLADVLARIHPDDRARVRAALDAHLLERAPYAIEVRALHADGSSRTWFCRGQAAWDAEGKPTHMAGSVSDVTAQRATEDALRASEERYRTYIRLSTEGIWRVELEHPVAVDLPDEALLDAIFREAYVAECNDAMARMYGLDGADDLIGARLADLMPRDDPRNVAYLTAFARSGWRLEHSESHEIDKDGRPKVFINSLVGVIEDGHVLRAWGTQRDATEQRFAEAALKQAVEARDTFLTVASHELKTPLTPLTLKLDLLGRALASPEPPSLDRVRADVENMQRQVKRLDNLVDDLLDVARLSTGRMRLVPEPVELGALARDVAARFEGEAARAGSVLRVVGDGVHGEWDRLRLEQVVANLVSNAIKYGCGKPVHLEVAQVGRSEAVLRVRDGGIGIAPEALQRIFEKFERAVADGGSAGLGLGLYVAREIVAAMGGNVRAESAPGNGATFIVELPLACERRENR